MSPTIQPSWRFIERVACPQCEAPEGGHCRAPKGGIQPPHGKRRELAADKGVWLPGEPAEAQPS